MPGLKADGSLAGGGEAKRLKGVFRLTSSSGAIASADKVGLSGHGLGRK